ncbi:WD40 repeat - like 10, partial [Theobroma cacao]
NYFIYLFKLIFIIYIFIWGIGAYKGHFGVVLCLAVGDTKLYYGSVDHTIRVWDTDTLQCIKSLNGHEDAVMSLLHYNRCLFSCSLDCNIKVWFATEGENWEVIYSHKEENKIGEEDSSFNEAF